MNEQNRDMTEAQRKKLRKRMGEAMSDMSAAGFQWDKCKKRRDHLSLYLLEAIDLASTPDEVAQACRYAMEELACSLRAADAYADELETETEMEAAK